MNFNLSEITINNYDNYKKCLLNLSFGKRLNNAIYVYKEALLNIDNDLSDFVKDIGESINIDDHFNVIKFILSEFRISFLKYPNFFEIPHPVLHSSISVHLSTGKIRQYQYLKSDNPPILHRKETLLESGHPMIPRFEALTKSEEKEGLYQNLKIIGFKKNWEQILTKKGLSYKGHELIKTKIKCPSEELSKEIIIKRHKTAIVRYKFSTPIQTLIQYKLFDNVVSIFDYGCGRGDDVRGLVKMGYNASGWDPTFFPDEPITPAMIVNLGFVINIIEDPLERSTALQNAYKLAQKILVVSAMAAKRSILKKGQPYKDGILTSIGTFQKYYYQDELRQYIEDNLNVSPIAIAPGIFYVFKNPIDKQAFIANRNKRSINRETLTGIISQKNLHDKKRLAQPKKKAYEDKIYDANKDLLDAFWNCLIDLGRVPMVNEFNRLDEIKEKIGTPNKAKKLFIKKYGEKELQKSFEQRKNDMLVYIALSNFKTKVPFKHLTSSLQKDITTFLGSYKKAKDLSTNLLFEIANPEKISNLCNQTSFGVIDHKALYIHKSLINDLHPILRIYIGCAGILYGDIHNVDIIKIHKRSGKVTLLIYDDFDKKNLPELQERIKINLKKQRIDIFDHSSGDKIQLLYFKDCYVSSNHPQKSRWEKFSKRLIKTGFKEPLIIGPTKQEFIEILNKKNLTKNLYQKKSSHHNQLK